jgi:hypothetical protein
LPRPSPRSKPANANASAPCIFLEHARRVCETSH